jgi:endonuclease YncB( thermonuclease family)
MRTLFNPAQFLKPLFLLIVVFSFILLSLPSHADLAGKVVKVTDGDTITVLDVTNTQHKIRLTGIDAPEKGQPFGTASRDNLASLVAGQQVQVLSANRDRYGRVLGKVILNGVDVNLAQLSAGMAWWYRYYAESQPPQDRASYELAEDTARAAGFGLWSQPDAIPPYDWRKGQR